ncbi:MAG: two-component system response regulator OmpR [Azoarcus sp.]|nr:two-component system response regulator OmpR [Azoarcus sp.]
MGKRIRILIVDDDARLRDLLLRYFHVHGYTAQAVSNGEEMDQAMELEHFDLIVLDLMLPGEDGMSICRRLRASGNTIPIIMLTAKGNDEDCIAGLETGADDYLGKPFNPRELIARIQAVIRRQPLIPPGAPEDHDEVFEFGRVRINLGTRKFYRDEVDIPITTGEFSLLKVLLQNPHMPFTRAKLMELSKGREYEAFNRTVDVQISRLRKLVEDDLTKPRYIQTVWGFGYVFVPDGRTHTHDTPAN